MTHLDKDRGPGQNQCNAQEFVPSAQSFELLLEKQKVTGVGTQPP